MLSMVIFVSCSGENPEGNNQVMDKKDQGNKDEKTFLEIETDDMVDCSLFFIQ